MPRDNFNTPTVRFLRERVACLCSNPACQRPTIGPSSSNDRSIIIGTASHITAASPGGPRYDQYMTSQERTGSDNGIWLCNNCSKLIDSDAVTFPIQLLKDWKRYAERQACEAILGGNKTLNCIEPALEADLIWTTSVRRPLGYSRNNPIITEPDGSQVVNVGPGYNPLINWSLHWGFLLTIYNQSPRAALNVKIEQTSNIKLRSIESLERINNIPPFEKKELDSTFIYKLESTSIQADEILSHKIPLQLDGLEIRISYLGSEKNQLSTIFTVVDNQITNTIGL